MNKFCGQNNSNFTNTWTEYKDSLMSYILKNSKSKIDVEDIYHDVFLKTFFGLETVRDKSKIKSWIFQVANNTIADFYRNKNKLQSVNNEDHVNKISEEKSKDESYKLIPIINSLPEKYREFLILSDIKGLPQKEIADILNLSLSATKSRIQRARILLKERMLECCNFTIDKYGNIIDCQEKAAYKKYKDQSPDKNY